jgi:hypothetical protein
MNAPSEVVSWVVDGRRWKESRVLKPDDSMCSRILKMGACIRRNPISESLNWRSPHKQRLHYNLRYGSS